MARRSWAIGKPPRLMRPACPGVSQGSQSRTDGAATLRSKLLEAIDAMSRSARAVDPEPTCYVMLLRADEMRARFETVGSCWMGQLWKFRGCDATAGEHRAEFAAASWREWLRICSNKAVSRAGTYSYHTIVLGVSYYSYREFTHHHTTAIMGIQNNKVYKLSNGVEMPAVGFGTFANEGSKGETYKAVTKALEVGYRHLDCAWFYQNEDEVGEAVRDFLKATPSVTRKDLFICTKLAQEAADGLHRPVPRALAHRRREERRVHAQDRQRRQVRDQAGPDRQP
ncbi:hypothetical protein OPT61_g8324 [Boeremia exigua]|uniref:Uncharacterized protein n=1 Tax=Boeremia exigua TaxID=749465 RepID=A0ACC2HZ44_9PLEO|nr:hypothetical protein OPT61_g8324 [Boeremia exigua]